LTGGYSSPFARCPICHDVFRSSVSRQTLTTSVPMSHFDEVHPEYGRWRRGFTWKFILSPTFPIVVVILMGLGLGFRTPIDLFQGEIILLSFLPFVIVFARLSLVNRRFRQEWVAEHGR